MNATEMIRLMNRIPFEAFEIHLSDGTCIHVEQPYHIATRIDRPTFIIYDDEGRMRIVAYRNVTEVITAATAS